MTRDRTGEEREEPPPHRCNNRWLGEDEEGRPIPCLLCKKHLTRPDDTDDYDPSRLSPRARAAIEKDNQND